MQVSVWATLLGSFCLLLPLAHGRASVVLEHRQKLPNGWRIEADAPLNETLCVSIALKQPRLADLGAYMLQRVGRPEKAFFAHLSPTQLAAYQAPHDDAAQYVRNWLNENQIRDTRTDGSWVRMNATVDRLQRLFEAGIAYYVYRNSTTPVMRARSYSIPADLAEYVDFVFPLAHFMPPADSRQTSKQSVAATHRRKRRTKLERRQQQSKVGNAPGGNHGGHGGSNSGGSPWDGWDGGGWDPPDPAPDPGPDPVGPGPGGGPGQGQGHTNVTFAPWTQFMACIPSIMTPGCIRQMYNWPLNPHTSAAGNKTTPARVTTTSTVTSTFKSTLTSTRSSTQSEPSEESDPAARSAQALSEKVPAIPDASMATSLATPRVEFAVSAVTAPPKAPTASQTTWPFPFTTAIPIPPPTSPVRFGVAGFLSEYVNHQDVNEFLQFYAPTIAFQGPGNPIYNFSIEFPNNGTNIQAPRYLAGMEASLDMEYAMALAYPSQMTFYSTGGRADKINPTGHHMDPLHSSNEPYLDLLEYLIALPADAVPHVLSISYSDDEQTVPQPYATRVCELFMQLAARGTTVLVATGDGGSHGISDTCTHSDASQRHPLLPTFPASCPWVTAVGSTETGIGAPGSIPPAVAADYSSGGFSNYFARPAWQNDTVNAYLGRIGDSKAGFFNRSGRGIPDISAIGSHFAIIWGGVPSVTSGTSASTPVVAAMVALVNDQRLKAGKPSLGWLNGALYSPRVQGLLEDVTMGISMGCMPYNRTVWKSGWPAAPGWDAVTGLGVPNNFAKLAAALMDV